MTTERLKKFYEKLGRLYREELFVHKSAWGKARRRFVKKILKKYVAQKACLDVGCGGGMYLSYIRNYGATHTIAMDISHPVLLRAGRAEPNAQLICADAEMVPLKESSVQLILCSETLEHLENPNAFFRDAERILSGNGILIITCPNWNRKRPKWVDTGILRHFGIEDDGYIHTAYRPDELVSYATKYGLEVIASGTFEQEMRLWGRVYDAICATQTRFLERLGIPSSVIRTLYFLQVLFSGIIYELLRFTGVASLMRKLFRRGPRSYIVARKG